MRLEPVGHRLLDRSPTPTKVSVVYNNRLFRQMLVERRVVVVNQHSDAFVKVGVGQFFVHLDKLLLVVLSYPYIEVVLRKCLCYYIGGSELRVIQNQHIS